MRRIKKHAIILGLMLSGFAAIGQDIHFSQFNSAPLLLNPALSGVNAGNYRLVANYKSQWTGLAPYNTVAASYDMNMFKHSTRANFGGLGVFFFTDKAGDSELRTTQANLNLSYTVMLNRRATHSLSTGIMGGIGYRTINYANLTFDNQFAGGYDPTLPNGENFATNKVLYPDVGAGVLWNFVRNEKLNFYAGGSVVHLNMPNLSFMNERDEKLYIKYTVHGGGYIGMSKMVFFLPSFLYMNQGPHHQFNFGGLVKMRKSLIPSDNTAFYVGGWYRLKDALILNARVDVGHFNIGFSYDINLSGLTPASNANGGPEVSLIYTGFFPSKKNTIVYCPPML